MLFFNLKSGKIYCESDFINDNKSQLNDWDFFCCLLSTFERYENNNLKSK